MSVTQLRGHLKEHWPRIKEDLLDGRYQPAPVRGCKYPSPVAGCESSASPRWWTASSSRA